MRNIKLTLSYDGTCYHGFQDQGEHLPTVQGELEKAINRLTGERLRVCAAGRTDAGTHALGQVVNLRTHSGIPVERWPYALNAVLPSDIVATEAHLVPLDFHARHSAVEKTYRYSIDNGRFPQVLLRRYAYHVPEPLDVGAMAIAAQYLVGRHDFAAFRAIGSSTISTTRSLRALQVESHSAMIHVTASADGFLYNMVRIIVGTLLEVGRGKQPPLWVKAVLAGRERAQAGATAPPHGLCLMSARYRGPGDGAMYGGETTT